MPPGSGKRLKGARRLQTRPLRRRDDYYYDYDYDEPPPPNRCRWYALGCFFGVCMAIGIMNIVAVPMPRIEWQPDHDQNWKLHADLEAQHAMSHTWSPPLVSSPQANPELQYGLGSQPAPVLNQMDSFMAQKPHTLRPPAPANPDKALAYLQPPAFAKQTSKVSIADSSAGSSIGVFDGEEYISLYKVVDNEEVTVIASIYLPDIPRSRFPGTSETMKTIVSTKRAGCAVNAQTQGWALFVHEWGTLNRQLRLSWTDPGSACNELFSMSALIPYEKWVSVGFSLSSRHNRARLFIDGQLVADTTANLGTLARGDRRLALDDSRISTRKSMSEPRFFVGGHEPQEDDPDGNSMHGFVGFIKDARVFHDAIDGVAGDTKDMESKMELLSGDMTKVLQSNIIPPSAVLVWVLFKSDMVINSLDSERFRVIGYGARRDNPLLPVQHWAAKPTHPLGDQGAVNIPSGPTFTPEALSQSWPSSWISKWGEEALRSSQLEANAWADEIRAGMRHSWQGYKARAFGHDEVKPCSGGTHNWVRLAITMLDSLSTLWLMDLQEEFDQAETWITQGGLSASRDSYHGLHSFFEITIRALGGLLSAHSLSGKQIFLDSAKQIATKMMPAFKTDSGIPKSQIDVGTGESQWHSWVQHAILAEATTIQLEFRYLTHHTGERQFKDAVDKAFNAVLGAARGRGLIPIYLTKGGAHIGFGSTKISLGAMGDSYYEYLLKMWQQNGKSEERLKETWKAAMREMFSRLVQTTNNGLLYIAEEENGQKRHRMDHLACFVAGMLVHGAHSFHPGEVDPQWEPTAEKLTHTCFEMYRRSPTGLSPEYAIFRNDRGSDMIIPDDAPHNLLRPEAAEAIYYMWYYTGDHKYRRMAHEMFQAFDTHSRTRFGYSAVRDVRQKPPRMSDSQESFWLAETLKYLYLTMVPRTTLDLEQFVFNTEAHPLRVWERPD